MGRKSLRATPPLATIGSFVALAILLALPVAAARPVVGHVGVATASGGLTTTSCPVGVEPQLSGYDPVNHDLYVPNTLSHNISVLTGACALVGTITLPIGSQPFAAAFDPANHRMYVTDPGLGLVYVISGLTVVANVSGPLIDTPNQILWDPAGRLMLASNAGGGNFVVGISGTSVAGSTGTGAFPQGLCYDPSVNSVLVTNRLTDNVTILNASHPLSGSTGSFGTGSSPIACAYDPRNHDDYVVNLQSHNVSVVTGSGVHVGSVGVGSFPAAVIWDPSDHRILVLNSGHGHISVLRGLHVVATIATNNKAANGLVFDPKTTEVYVTTGIGTVVVVP
jgi:DNA-binding beta-propeller fold protein YncE